MYIYKSYKFFLILTIVYSGLIAFSIYNFYYPINVKAEQFSSIKKSATLKPTFKPTTTVISTPTPEITCTPMIKKVVKPVIKKKDIPKDTPPQGEGTIYTVSAYDLSVESCGKSRNSKGFGRTASGFNLANQSRESAMTIAADTRILKMGTKVYLNFISSHVKKYNGVYTVRDTGGAIKGRKLDLYFGDDPGVHQRAMNFGVQKAMLTIVE